MCTPSQEIKQYKTKNTTCLVVFFVYFFNINSELSYPKHKSLSKPSKTGSKVGKTLRMVSAIFINENTKDVLDAKPYA